VHEALQEAMQDDAGISRTEESLRRALSAVEDLGERAERMRVSGTRRLNPGWHTCRDVENMLAVSEAIVRCALARRESRGSHWRLDFPEMSDDQGHINYVASDDRGDMRITAVPVEPVPDRLRALIATEERLRAATTIPIPPTQRDPDPPVQAGAEAV
ncbi:MAG TPA: fumarate reductase/succinate dehydrogenase flavoprotein subunit, partial [Candidatus Dormibacteraeota bacterium]|nr:fumarate reductase/succinate dehydrogenase flavoprotein subunit [Candidatus Dormibacteraeota bacterium]